MSDVKIFIENKDYLPDGMTWEKLYELAEKKSGKPVKLTEESLAEIVDPKFLDMTEDDLLDYISKHMDQSVLPTHNLGPTQPRLAYAENLEENDELNQDFPEVKDE